MGALFPVAKPVGAALMVLTIALFETQGAELRTTTYPQTNAVMLSESISREPAPTTHTNQSRGPLESVAKITEPSTNQLLNLQLYKYLKMASEVLASTNQQRIPIYAVLAQADLPRHLNEDEEFLSFARAHYTEAKVRIHPNLQPATFDAMQTQFMAKVIPFTPPRARPCCIDPNPIRRTFNRFLTAIGL